MRRAHGVRSLDVDQMSEDALLQSVPSFEDIRIIAEDLGEGRGLEVRLPCSGSLLFFKLQRCALR